jgi:AAA+ ATPase superfamily predicted ATPase
MVFLNRQNELDTLESLYKSPRGEMVALYGWRRVGKTSLLREFVRDKPHIFFTADANIEKEQVRAFARLVEGFMPEEGPLGRFETWPDVLRFLIPRLQAMGEKIVVALDEFPEITVQNPTVPSVLRAIWDAKEQGAGVMLLLCGSIVGEMRRLQMGEEPLYGRFTGRINLRPFDFPEMSLFFPARNFNERIETYAVLGGMPMYLSIGSESPNIWRTVEDQILNPTRILYEEVPYILGQELREPALYMAILACIARGPTRPAKIAAHTGIKPDTVSAYLYRLERMDIVRRDFPVTDKSPEKSRKVSYSIKDNFIRFWLRYVYPYKYLVESGDTDSLLSVIRRDFEGYLGIVAEEIVREAVRIANREDEFQVRFMRIGRYWDKAREIDICGVSEDGSAFLWGECRWRRTKMSAEDLKQLRDKVVASGVGRGSNSTFMLCSKSGFTKDLKRKAEDEGVILWDAEKLDKLSGQPGMGSAPLA